MTSIPPSTYLPGGFVTDINRQALWNALSEADRAAFTGPSSGGTTGTTGTGSTTGGTGTSGSTATFRSLGSTTTVSSANFAGRTDARSATPNAQVLSGYSSLWDPQNLMDVQLTASIPNGGALFVTVAAGTAANGDRPDDGLAGFNPNLRGANPYGFFDNGEFVKLTEGVETRFSGNRLTDPTGYNDWLTGARVQYDKYQALVTQQITEMQALFGRSQQGLLGFDVNNNGQIDNESELFGFDSGLNLNGSATIGYGQPGPGQTTGSFTFLNAANGRLAGDPLDPNGDSQYMDEYRRFMILTESGQSMQLLQSDIGYTAGIDNYVKAQTRFEFTASGAQLTIVTQDGFSVTPTVTQSEPVNLLTPSLPSAVTGTARPTDGLNGEAPSFRGQNPIGFMSGGNFYSYDNPLAYQDPTLGLTSTYTLTQTDPLVDPVGAQKYQDFLNFNNFVDSNLTTARTLLSGTNRLGFDLDGNGTLGATEFFGAGGLNIYGSGDPGSGSFTYLSVAGLRGDTTRASSDPADAANYDRFTVDAGGTQFRLGDPISQSTFTDSFGRSFDLTIKAAVDVLASGQFSTRLIAQVGSTVTPA